MNLNDTEKNKIIKLIKAGETLPKEYIYKLFGDEEDVFLFWNGRKEDITNIALPFHSIEHIDEPRKEKDKVQTSMFETDFRGRQLKGWTNKLIWGDNKLILSSLANGPLREEIENEGGLKLIYIDLPFAVGADFGFNIQIGGETAEKKQTIIEEIAYRDTWGKGISSYLSMMYERVKLMHNLLADNGSIYMHIDHRLSAFMRLMLNDVFGSDNLISEVIWKRSTAHGDAAQGARHYDALHDTILFYSKSISKFIWNTQYIPFSDEQIKQQYNKTEDGRLYRLVTPTASKPGGDTSYEWKGVRPPTGRYWAYTRIKMDEFESQGKLYYSNTGQPYIKYYLDERPGVAAQSI